MSDYKKYFHPKKKKLFSPLNIFLLAINTALLVSVIFLDPNKYIVVSVYFLETLIIGILNVVKMLSIYIYRKTRMHNNDSGSIFMIPFFIVHFGIFYFVQLALILGSGSGIDSDFPVKGGLVPNPLQFFKLTLGTEGRYIVLGIILMQLFVFIYAFLIKGEVRSRSLQYQMMEPYGRILVQQFVVIIGGFFIIFLGDAMAFSILLVIFKTLLDLFPVKFKTTTDTSNVKSDKI
jgi:hypothetical protein